MNLLSKAAALSESQVLERLGYSRLTRIDPAAPVNPPSLSNDARAPSLDSMDARGNERMFDEKPIRRTGVAR